MPSIRNTKAMYAQLILWMALTSLTSTAFAGQIISETTIATVAVNGGSDSPNIGTTCVQVTSPVSAACTGGYVAILNNNKQLIAAALLNKATASKIMFYYEEASGSNHCPGIVYTPCVVNSIQSR